MALTPPIRGLLDAARMFDPAAWRMFAEYYRPRRAALLCCALIASAQSLLVLPVLYLIRRAFDSAIPQGDIVLLIWIGAGLLAARAFNSGINLLTRWMTLRLVKGAVSRMRQDLVARLYDLSRAFHVQSDTDRLHTRLVQDTERVDTMGAVLLSGALPAVVASLVLLIVLLWLNPVLVALAAAVVPLLWLAGAATARLVTREVGVFRRAFEEFSSGIHFVLRHIDLTRQRGWEVAEQRRQRGHIEQLRHTGVRMALSYALHGQLLSNVTGLAGIVILVAGGVAVVHHTMTIGQLLAFYVAAGLLNTYVDRIAGALPELISGNAALVTLHGLRGSGPDVPYRGARRIAFTGGVELRDVSFAYGEHDVLRGVSLTIAPGACTAIVGPNGAGKTTLLDLVMGFARPAAGQVLAEGVPYEDLDLAELRRGLGAVPQHPSLFTGSVWDNVTYGRPDASPEQVATALRRARADDFLSRMPCGLDTPIAEGGAPFSAGECQRLAIARALLGEPRLLILDEPTTHLDVATVRRVMAALTGAAVRPAILIVSHDPEVIGFADAVWRIETGILRRIDAAVPTV